jgi:hypothetical protein
MRPAPARSAGHQAVSGSFGAVASGSSQLGDVPSATARQDTAIGER